MGFQLSVDNRITSPDTASPYGLQGMFPGQAQRSTRSGTGKAPSSTSVCRVGVSQAAVTAMGRLDLGEGSRQLRTHD